MLSILVAVVVPAVARVAGVEQLGPAISVRNTPQDQTVLLNRYTFGGNVLQGDWVVFFSAAWDTKCQQLIHGFRSIGSIFEQQPKSGLSPTVRFAVVDCTTEKELCNEQRVGSYPMVAHYRSATQVSQWHSGGRFGLLPWIRSELQAGGAGGAAHHRERRRVREASPEHHEARRGSAHAEESTHTRPWPLPTILATALSATIIWTSMDALLAALAAAASTQKTLNRRLLRQEGKEDEEEEKGRRRSSRPRYLPEKWGNERQTLVL